MTVDKERGRKVEAPVRFIDSEMLLSTHPKVSAVVCCSARVTVEINLSARSSRVSSVDGDACSNLGVYTLSAQCTTVHVHDYRHTSAAS